SPYTTLYRSLLVLIRCPTDGGREKQDLGPHQGRDARGFRIPLVPANEYTDGCKPGFENLVSQIAGREVEFFIKCRIIGNVHLPVFAEVGAISVNHGSGIVV